MSRSVGWSRKDRRYPTRRYRNLVRTKHPHNLCNKSHYPSERGHYWLYESVIWNPRSKKCHFPQRPNSPSRSKWLRPWGLHWRAGCRSRRWRDRSCWGQWIRWRWCCCRRRSRWCCQESKMMLSVGIRIGWIRFRIVRRLLRDPRLFRPLFTSIVENFSDFGRRWRWGWPGKSRHQCFAAPKTPHSIKIQLGTAFNWYWLLPQVPTDKDCQSYSVCYRHS